jgi:hypothetical protein
MLRRVVKCKEQEEGGKDNTRREKMVGNNSHIFSRFSERHCDVCSLPGRKKNAVGIEMFQPHTDLIAPLLSKSLGGDLAVPIHLVVVSFFSKEKKK